MIIYGTVEVQEHRQQRDKNDVFVNFTIKGRELTANAIISLKQFNDK